MQTTTPLRIATGIATLALLAGCHHKDHADRRAIAGTIKGHITSVTAAFNAHDAEKSVAFDSAEWIGMSHGAANKVGAAADLAAAKQQLADPAAKLVIGDPAIDVAKKGDMAVSRTTYAYTFTDPKTKKPATEHGNWVQQWKVQADGGWKAVLEVISDTPAPKT